MFTRFSSVSNIYVHIEENACPVQQRYRFHSHKVLNASRLRNCVIFRYPLLRM